MLSSSTNASHLLLLLLFNSLSGRLVKKPGRETQESADIIFAHSLLPTPEINIRFFF